MSAIAVEPVAKKKPEPAPEPEAKNRKPMIVQVRGSEKFKQWAEELARFDGLPLATLVERAMRKYAQQIGFTKEPPER